MGVLILVPPDRPFQRAICGLSTPYFLLHTHLDQFAVTFDCLVIKRAAAERQQTTAGVSLHKSKKRVIMYKHAKLLM